MTTPKPTWREVALTALDHTELALDAATSHVELAVGVLTRVADGAYDLGVTGTIEITERVAKARTDFLGLIGDATTEYAHAVTVLEEFLPPEDRTRTAALRATGDAIERPPMRSRHATTPTDHSTSFAPPSRASATMNGPAEPTRQQNSWRRRSPACSAAPRGCVRPKATSTRCKAAES